MKAFVKRIISFSDVVKYCLSIAWKASSKYTLLRVFSTVSLPILTIIQSYLIKRILDILTIFPNSDNSLYLICIIVLLLFVASLLMTIVNKASSYSQNMHSDIVTKYMIENLMRKSMDSDIAMFDNPRFYDQMNIVQRDATSMVDILWDALDLIGYITGIISSLIILSKASFLFGFSVLIASIPAAIAMRKYTQDLFYLELNQMKGMRNQAYSVHVATSREYAQDVRLFGIAKYIIQRYNTVWSRLFGEKRKLIKKEAIVSSILLFLPDAVISIAYVLIAIKIFEKYYSIGDFSYYSSMLLQVSSYTTLLIYSIMTIYENKLKIDNIQSFYSIKNQVQDSGKRTLLFIKEIEFSHVCFSYPETEKRVINDISFQIKQGDKIAVVGINGSGKTTLIKLLLRFYDPQEGEIRINGENIKEYTIVSLRRCFSAYMQNDPIFGFTLRENVKISEPETIFENSNDDIDEINRALEKSGAIKVLNKCGEKGLDTYITRMFDINGIELSGGEEQRLALARAFYRKCVFMILDEPSSSLDPEAENDIFNKLYELCEGKTVLFTSHRLSNLSLADRIIVIENGQIIEEGTQEELIKNNSRFAELYEYQAKKYIYRNENDKN